MRQSLLAALAALTFGTASPAAAAIIFEDSFEQPGVASWAVFQNGVGDTGAWFAEYGAGIEIQNQSIGITAAYHGAQYVELDSDNSRGGLPGGTHTGMIAYIPFVVGQTYEISFAYKPRTATANDNGIRLYALNYNGSVVLNSILLAIGDETTATLSNWTIISALFTATPGMNSIGFEAFGIENTLGGFIDMVRVATVNDVPVPAALPLFLLGVGGIAALRRRKAA